MTILVAINLGDCAIVVADKQESYMHGDTVLWSHNKAQKIVETNIGLITGSGWVDLLTPVKTAIANASIDHTDKALSLIQNERNKFLSNPFLPHHHKSDILSTTGWIMTYRTLVQDDCRMRVVLFHPSINEEKFVVVGENTSEIIFPKGTSQETMDECFDLLPTDLGSQDGIDLQDRLNKYVRLSLEIVDRVSKATTSVSRECDIGLAMLDGTNLYAQNASKDIPQLRFEPHDG